jgi:hypothetical protein
VKVPENYDGKIKWEVAFYTAEEYRPFELCGNEIGFEEDFFLEIDKDKINKSDSLKS